MNESIKDLIFGNSTLR